MQGQGMKMVYMKILETTKSPTPRHRSTLETGNRCSGDVKVNTPERKLWTFCSSHSLELPNDQTPGDRLGNLTCFNNMGASVVDFLVLSRSLMKNVINFKVFHPTLIPSMHQLLLVSRVLLLNLEKEKSQGTVLFLCLLNQKDTH